MPFISGGGGGIPGVVVSGTPASGQALIASSASAATWSNQTFGLIATSTLGSSGTISLTNLDQTYTDLVVCGTVRGTRNAVADICQMTLNSDSTAGHYEFVIQGYDNSALNRAYHAGNLGLFPSGWSMPAATATANEFCSFEVHIFGYAGTSANKNIIGWDWGDWTTGGTATAGQDFFAGTWLQTSAVTSLQFQGNTTANLAAGSKVSVYGRQ